MDFWSYYTHFRLLFVVSHVRTIYHPTLLAVQHTRIYVPGTWYDMYYGTCGMNTLTLTIYTEEGIGSTADSGTAVQAGVLGVVLLVDTKKRVQVNYQYYCQEKKERVPGTKHG